MNGGGGGQKKRGTRIEPFRHRVETDPKFFDKSWRKLHDAIREIYNHNASGLSFEELYRLTLFLVAPPLFRQILFHAIRSRCMIADDSDR
jgi:cullin 3